MGRKIKYNKELKIEIVKRYLKGESITTILNEYDMGKSDGMIRRWVSKYDFLGEHAFDFSTSNRKYDKKLKMKVVEDYLSGKYTYVELSNIYDISGHDIVRKWVKKYNQGIEIKDSNPKGDVYTMKSRKTTLEEKLAIIKYVLSHENDYKGAANIYSIPYASVYQWTNKYKVYGEDGLKDSRGRPSTSKTVYELTTEEKQAIHIKKLELELKRQKMINEVLKKNIEIQKQLDLDSLKSYKKTNTKL